MTMSIQKQQVSRRSRSDVVESTESTSKGEARQLPNFKWAGNAEAVYDKSISSTPRLFRHYTRDGLNELLMERYGEKKAISEAQLVEIIKEYTPAPFLGKGMRAIRPVLTDPSLADL